jgi:hypothetical protein
MVAQGADQGLQAPSETRTDTAMPRHQPTEVNMSDTHVSSETAAQVHRPGTIDMKLEVQIIPVSDVNRAKEFYEQLGWRLDDDVAPLDGLLIVQFTPPGSGTSITFGTGLTTAAPGAAEGGLIVSDIEADARRARRP